MEEERTQGYWLLWLVWYILSIVFSCLPEMFLLSGYVRVLSPYQEC